MKATEMIKLLEYTNAFGNRKAKPIRMKQEKKKSSLQELIEIMQEAEEVKAYLASKEKKEDKKKDDEKKGWKLETINQAIFLQIAGTFVGVFLAQYFLVVTNMVK